MTAHRGMTHARHDRRLLAVQAYVAFSDASGAAASKAAIHGRMFAGVSLQVNFVTQEFFTGVAGAL